MKTRAQITFDKVRRLKKEQWPNAWLSDTAPGDLLLLSPTWGSGGALLKISRSGAFLSLDSDQTWNQKDIDWIDTSNGISILRLIGDQVVLD
jgi:hypothetical protein